MLFEITDVIPCFSRIIRLMTVKFISCVDDVGLVVEENEVIDPKSFERFKALNQYTIIMTAISAIWLLEHLEI